MAIFNKPNMGKVAASAMGAGGFVQGQNNQPRPMGPSNDMLMQLLPLLIQQFSQRGNAMNAPGMLSNSIFAKQGLTNQANQPMQFPSQPMPANQPIYPSTSFAPGGNTGYIGGILKGMNPNELRLEGPGVGGDNGDRQVNVDPNKFRF